MKRIIAVFLVGIGVVLAAVTAVQSSNRDTEKTVDVTVPSGDSTVVYTQPGVLELVDDSVDVTLSAPGQNIQWTLGRIEQVEAWVGQSNATSIDGLESWDSAKYTVTTGEKDRVARDKKAGSQDSFNLFSSDLWMDENTAQDKASFTVTSNPEDQTVLIATTSGAVAPEVTLAWTHTLAPANAIPVIAIGVLLALVGLFLLLQDHYERSKTAAESTRHNAKSRARAGRLASDDSETMVLPALRGDLVDEDRKTQRAHTDSAFGAGILPGTARTEVIRARELDPVDRLELPRPEPETEAHASFAPKFDQTDDVIDDAARQHQEQIAETQGALGAGILPATSRAEEFRSRELAQADRLIIADPEGESVDQTSEEIGLIPHDEATDVVSDLDVKESDHDEKTDTDDADTAKSDDAEPTWRSMWNFEWGSPYKSKGDNDA